MAMITTTRPHEDSLVQVVRRLKEENAAEHGFNIRAIGEAARRHQLDHPGRIVSREPKMENKSEQATPMKLSD